MSTIRKTIFGASLLAAVATVIFEARHASQLRDKNQRLVAQFEQLTRERGLALSHATSMEAELDRFRRDQEAEHLELMRLRGQAGQLERMGKELADLKRAHQEQSRKSAQARTNDSVEATEPIILPRETWSFAGYETPGNALQSVFWAMKSGDVQTFLASLTPEGRESAMKQFEGKLETEIAAALQEEVKELQALRLDRVKQLSETEATFVLNSEEKNDGVTRFRSEAVATFRNIQGQWKCTGL